MSGRTGHWHLNEQWFTLKEKHAEFAFSVVFVVDQNMHTFPHHSYLCIRKLEAALCAANNLWITLRYFFFWLCYWIIEKVSKGLNVLLHCLRDLEAGALPVLVRYVDESLMNLYPGGLHQNDHHLEITVQCFHHNLQNIQPYLHRTTPAQVSWLLQVIGYIFTVQCGHCSGRLKKCNGGISLSDNKNFCLTNTSVPRPKSKIILRKAKQ